AKDRDVVYVNEHLALLAVLAAKLRGKKCAIRIMVDGSWEIAHRYGWTDDDIDAYQRKTYGFKVWLARTLQKWWWNRVDAIVSCSDYLRRIVIGYGIEPDKVRLIHNVYNGPKTFATTKAQAREKLGVPADRKVVVTVCRLMVWKGVDGLIRAGSAQRVLLITSETYSKYIHPSDRSLRTIFGDGAAATLVEAADEPSLGSFIFGTDGRGAAALMVADGGARPPEAALKPNKRKRWPSRLYMDGPELVKFTLEVVPPLVDRILADTGLTNEEVDFYLMHQATVFMIDHLRNRLLLDSEKVPVDLDYCGNTVSSTIPILMHDLRRSGKLKPGKRSMMIGFGVGFSWAGCMWTETWAAEQALANPAASHQAA
ncbi:MAG: glycosyltransferase, partial [Pirellulales bacterium]|nr:glycosyltransferase [Pirellulales bacterium]